MGRATSEMGIIAPGKESAQQAVHTGGNSAGYLSPRLGTESRLPGKNGRVHELECPGMLPIKQALKE